MHIKLIMDLPVAGHPHLLAGKVLKVLRREEKNDKGRNGKSVRQSGYWIRDDNEDVKVLDHECIVTEDVA